MEKANPVISSSWAVGVRIDTAHAGERELDYRLSYRLGQPQDMLGILHFLNGEHGLPVLQKGRNSD